MNTARMFTSVRETLAEHETNNTWTEIPALVKVVTELDPVITGIAAQLEILALPSGAVSGKNALLEALARPAYEVAAALHAFATASDDDELAARVDFSVTDIAEGRPAAVVARCANFVALATEDLDSLSDYNITQPKLTALTKKITAFEKQVPKPRQGIARKAAANKAARRFLAQGRKLLNKRLDKLMVQFRETEPELYAEYKTARKIVNSAAPSNDKKAVTVASTSAPATNGTATNGVATVAQVVAAPAQNGHSAPEAAAEKSTETLVRSA